MNINEEIKELRCRLDKLEQEVTSENHDYELYLEVDKENQSLDICFLHEYTNYNIGSIFETGQCHILNDFERRNYYEIWCSKGKKIRENTEVEWRGKKYYFNNHKVLYSAKFQESEVNFETATSIYNFYSALPCLACTDENIVRYENNNTPILF